MKFKWNVLFGVMLVGVQVSNAQVGDAKLLFGKWKVESLSPQFPAGARAEQRVKGQKVIAEDTKNYGRTGFVFSPDGILLVEGKKLGWSIGADGRTVTVKKGKRTVTVATIMELSANKLVFTRPDEGMIVTYVLVR